MEFLKSKFSVLLDIPDIGTILFNTVYGTVDRLDKSVENAWNDNISLLTTEQAEFLYKRGHLINRESDARLLEKVEESLQNRVHEYSKFYISFSLACNFSCFYCFENKQNDCRLIKSEELDGVFSAIDEIAFINKAKKNEIVLFGGEPFLERNKPLIQKTLAFAREKHYRVGAITNGSNLESYQRLFEEYLDVLGFFSITIDGTKEDHDCRRVYANGKGSYDDIVSGMQLLKELGISVSVRMNIDKNFKGNISSAIDELEKNLGFRPYVSLALVDDTTCTGDCLNTYDLFEITKELLKLGYFDVSHKSNFAINIKPIVQLKALLSNGQIPRPRFQYCHVGELYLFSVDGRIYCCPQSCQNEEFCIGEYYPELVIDQERVRYFHTISSIGIDFCKDCAWQPICGGGCYIKRAYNNAEGNVLCYKKDLENSASILISHYLGGDR